MKGKIMKSKSKSYLIAKIIVFIIFAIYAFTLLYALAWAFITSFKDQFEYMKDKNGLPDVWHFDNYLTAIKSVSVNDHGMLAMLINSLWYAGGGAVLGTLVSSMVAYVVAKYRFPGRNVLYTVALLTMMLPIVGAMPSQYKVYTTLGIINSPFMLLSLAGGFGFNFVVLYSYFKSLPWSYAEAGFLDGASHLTVFMKIMLPQAINVMGALLIVAGIGLWNDYMAPILFLRDFPTLSAGLYVYQMQTMRKLNVPVLFAGLLLSVLPVIVLFVCFQNTMMDMTMAGGLKG